MSNIVCVRRISRMPGCVLIGKPGYVDPQTGVPFIDEANDTWQTSKPCCEQCGEMYGTRRRHYMIKAWPHDNSAVFCKHCGKKICQRCAMYFRTDRVVGEHTRRTEGGYKYKVPTHEEIPLCKPCADAERELRNSKPKQMSAGDALLRRLGLMP